MKKTLQRLLYVTWLHFFPKLYIENSLLRKII